MPDALWKTETEIPNKFAFPFDSGRFYSNPGFLNQKTTFIFAA